MNRFASKNYTERQYNSSTCVGLRNSSVARRHSSYTFSIRSKNLSSTTCYYRQILFNGLCSELPKPIPYYQFFDFDGTELTVYPCNSCSISLYNNGHYYHEACATRVHPPIEEPITAPTLRNDQLVRVAKAIIAIATSTTTTHHDLKNPATPSLNDDINTKSDESRLSAERDSLTTYSIPTRSPPLTDKKKSSLPNHSLTNFVRIVTIGMKKQLQPHQKQGNTTRSCDRQQHQQNTRTYCRMWTRL